MTKRYPKPTLQRNLLTLSCLLTALAAQAQRYSHATVWTRVQVTKKLGTHWELQGEYHLRRQNNFHHSRWQPFENPYLSGYRLQVSYRSGPWTVQFLPTYFFNYPLLGKDEDFNNPAGAEWRFVGYVEWAKTWKRFTLRLRPGYEYRLLERNDYRPTGRARFRVQGRLAFGDHLRWILGTEPMLNVGPNPAPLVFNQNQAYTGLDFDLISNTLGLEIGYYYLFRQRRTVVEFDDEHALNIQLKIRL